MRKVFLELRIRLVVNADEGVEVQEVIDEIEVATQAEGADVESSEIVDYEVTDSK